MTTDWAHTHARTTDPHTSHAAATLTHTKRSMMARLEAVYAAAHPRGLTVAEVTAAAGYPDAYGVSKRLSDLVHAGVLVETGQTRPGPSTREQRVLEWVPPHLRGDA